MARLVKYIYMMSYVLYVLWTVFVLLLGIESVGRKV